MVNLKKARYFQVIKKVKFTLSIMWARRSKRKIIVKNAPELIDGNENMQHIIPKEDRAWTVETAMPHRTQGRIHCINQES